MAQVIQIHRRYQITGTGDPARHCLRKLLWVRVSLLIIEIFRGLAPLDLILLTHF